MRVLQTFALSLAVIGALAPASPAFAKSAPPTRKTGTVETILGTVSAVSSTTLTVHAKNPSQASSTLVYTVDTSLAKIAKMDTETTLSNILVDDPVIVQGVVRGTTIIATLVIDKAVPGSTLPATPPTVTKIAGRHTGFFASIGGFFVRFFHFEKWF